uniref:C-type lectin domain-containing protein n=1 Tax=Sinocyclocheilus grahami TaxID=75366 RepID=A0A672PER6_SINGR
MKKPKTWTQRTRSSENKLIGKQDYQAWIGLSKNMWLWQWSDNTSVSWSSVKWESGQPNNVNASEECVRAGTEGLIADDTCSTPLFKNKYKTCAI